MEGHSKMRGKVTPASHRRGAVDYGIPPVIAPGESYHFLAYSRSALSSNSGNFLPRFCARRRIPSFAFRDRK